MPYPLFPKHDIISVLGDLEPFRATINMAAESYRISTDELVRVVIRHFAWLFENGIISPDNGRNLDDDLALTVALPEEMKGRILETIQESEAALADLESTLSMINAQIGGSK